MNKLLTVIVPIYNVSKYLEQCLDSIINQTYTDLEIILVDDGSKDDSGKICDDYAKKDTRIKVIHKTNGGVTSARKAGLLSATGYYVAFVDGDDWIDLNMYEVLVNEMEHNHLDAITSGYYKECGDSTTIVYDGLSEGIYTNNSDVLCKNLIYVTSTTDIGINPNMWNKIFVTEYVKEHFLCIDDSICFGEDAACVYSYFSSVGKVEILHKPFYHYRFRESSIVHEHNDKILIQLGSLYLHLKNRLQNNKYYEFLRKQLEIFTTLNVISGLNYHMGFNDDVKIPMYLIPNRVFSYGNRIILYGAGMVGQAYERQLSILDDTVLVKWVDQMAHFYRNCGKDVYEIEDIKKCTYDVILLAVRDFEMMMEIKTKLKNMGVQEEKIYWEMPKTILEQYIGTENR